MKALVTGGAGFLGAALCRELLAAGYDVRVMDDLSRGTPERLRSIAGDLEFVQGDVRDYDQVRRATSGCRAVWHLAYINGTRFFYERPDDVLEVGIKGALHTIEAALDSKVERYVLASSSETYNVPTHVPTTESERLVIPDVTNPRFSYGGGKIASELLALHYGQKRGLPTVIFRPHNFYGPQMGFEHLVPEVIERIVELSDGLNLEEIDLPIQGDGSETRAFCFVDDGATGSFIAGEKGVAGEIYHVGRQEETTIADAVHTLASCLGVRVNLLPGERRPGGTPRRCPDIGKLRALGYEPKVANEEGFARAARWYADYFLSKGKS